MSALAKATLARRDPAAASAAFQAIATPLFAMAAAAGGEVTVKLEGIARAPGRIAALLSINGAPAEWLAPGEERNGVVLQEVSASKVILDTTAGQQEVVLGAPPATPSVDEPPPGFRMPPPPASAPGLKP